MTTYYYTDGYLAPLVTQDREDRAIADVAALGTLPADWVQRLGILRGYIVTCLECQKAPDDTFGAKLSAYRKEYVEVLTQARSAQARLEAQNNTLKGGASVFTAEIARG